MKKKLRYSFPFGNPNYWAAQTGKLEKQNDYENNF